MTGTQPLEAQANILGKLLLVQQTLDVLPDSESIATFLQRALVDIPGVTEVHLCIHGEVIPASGDIKALCYADGTPCTDTSTAFVPIDKKNLFYAPLNTARIRYGYLILSLDNHDAFQPYKDFLLNVANVIAMDMENREYIRQINDVNINLEKRIAERAAELKESEEKFRAITTSAQDAIIMMDNEGKITGWNRASERIFGHAEQEAIGKKLHTLLAPERFREDARKGIGHYTRTGKSPIIGKTVELAAIRKDGAEFPIELSLSTVKLGGKWHAIGIVRDISERKRSEETQLRINRALETISSCNSVLIHATNENELLKQMCRVIVDIGGFRMAWFGFADHDDKKTVRPVAHYGHESGYLEHADITWADTKQGGGPTGTAIRTGEIQVNQDFESNPQMHPWRKEALRCGYNSSIALPLGNDGEIFGALTIYSGEPDAFNDDEVKLLAELTGDAAYGIMALRTQADRTSFLERLQANMEATIRAIAHTVEVRDPYTAGHQDRVAELAIAIACEMGLADERIHGLRLAASIHDIGKIHIPAEILSKPSRLSDIEFSLIKTHPRIGYDILKGIEFPWPIADIVLQHHERLDGSGYPQGLKGDAILLESRILAVADVVEAISSHRPYRPGLGTDAALEELEKGRGRIYDADAVDACIRLFEEKRFSFQPE